MARRPAGGLTALRRVSVKWLAVGGLVVVGLPAYSLFHGWYGTGPLPEARDFSVPDGASLNVVAKGLAKAGAVRSAWGFRLHARLLGGKGHVKAGEFRLPKGASESDILKLLTGDGAIRRYVTVPEGLPSIMVAERLTAEPFLSGPVKTPEEGSVLPETYDFKRDEPRAEVLSRMQAAMASALAEAWAKRAPGLVVKTPQEALTLASIVEKETGKPEERPMVAALYENRLRVGMRLQADPTIIYPITKGKPLGRRILESEITARNDYNTYSMAGLPKGPITNPGRASIEAVLHPAKTDALYMVADGTGGHAFAATLEEHNRNVARWFALRRARGEI